MKDAVVKERPILFSGPMVLAILDGRKTQTRRVMKTQPPHGATELGVEGSKHATKGEELIATYRAYPDGGTARWGICACPYGVPRDRLWVKESWATKKEWNERSPMELPIETSSQKRAQEGCVAYLASGLPPSLEHSPIGRTRASMHMPRWASRITLEITEVRVERLQEMTHREAQAEGVRYDLSKEDGSPLPRFRKLWDSINGKTHPWNSNPFVWAITFRKL